MKNKIKDRQTKVSSKNLLAKFIDKIRKIIFKKVSIEECPTFDLSLNNEQSTDILIRDKELYFDEINEYRIYYISDMHLTHKIVKAELKTERSISKMLQDIVDRMLEDIEDKSILLVGGDTASDIYIFQKFVNILNNTIEKTKPNLIVVFVLGNHELWDRKDSLETTIDNYRQVIDNRKMILLQNEILYQDRNGFHKILENDIFRKSKEEIKAEFAKARLVIYGGIGFSGYNDVFNADNGIYQTLLDRKQEVIHTQKFENIYNRICNILSEKQVIVLSHMPYYDWNRNSNLNCNYIYISGHTHKNEFYNDTGYKFYADNQIGYYKNNFRLKSFYVDTRYDIFKEYDDGIYEIDRETYLEFNRGKNINITFNKNFDKLYMLKKNGYYCFIIQTTKGEWGILSGGAHRKIIKRNRSLQYYYDNMDSVIRKIEEPFKNYQEYQNKISNEVKKIGGSGRIHGCIIDIDFFNHLYINPLDLTITPYFAVDIINKVVYKDVASLLKAHCIEIYNNFEKRIGSNSVFEQNNSQLMPTKFNDTKLYLETDIYKTSRVMKKMQRLTNKILTIWIEDDDLKQIE